MTRSASLLTGKQMVSHSRSNPDAILEMKFSDDSSIFSGLVDQENEMKSANAMPESVGNRQPKGILRASSYASSAENYNLGVGSRESSELFPKSGTSLAEGGQRSVMRDMRPIVDAESASGNSSISTASSNRREDLVRGGVNNLQLTWASPNEVQRSKGTVKLVSSQTNFERTNGNEMTNIDLQFINECRSGDSDSGIVDILDDFERQMDANIKSLRDENDENEVLTDFNKNIDTQNVDTQSQESQFGHLLTPRKAKKLQKILQKARKEVEILRDNNEQYKSEIEQMEEEHKSEVKLVEDRAKHKLVELKNMYQHEIDSLAQEKDAAVIEAGRVAARYAENGKRQVSTMQKQVDKLKAAAALTLREKIKEERESVTKIMQKEFSEKLKSLEKSQNNELEKLKQESNQRLKDEVEKAVSSVAKRVRLNQDVLISELRNQVDELRCDRRTTIEVLDSVKSKFMKHYPEEMIEFKEKSLNLPGSAEELKKNAPAFREREDTLKEVIEIFSFLLEYSEKKAALAKQQYEIEETKKDSRRMLVLRHKTEIESLMREKEEKDDMLKKLEEDFKVLSKEKCLLHEKYQMESESHKLELERINAEKEAFMNIGRSRKDLENVKANVKKEIAQQQRIATEEVRFTSSSLDLSLSISTPKGTSVTGKLASSSDHRESIELPQTPSTESTSIRKARAFQKNHPKFMPRYSARDSPRHRPSEYLSPKLLSDSSHGTNRTPNNIANDHSISDCRSITSNCSVQSNGTLSDLRNQVREAEGQVFDLISTMSDSVSKTDATSEKSIRSKETILSNFRNQSKKTVDNDGIEFLKEKFLSQEKKDMNKIPSEEKIQLSKTEKAIIGPKRKKLAILRRNFQKRKETNKNDTKTTSIQEVKKKVKGKKEGTDIISQERILKQLMYNGQDDSSLRSRRESLDESISSLQTNNGVRSKESMCSNQQHQNFHILKSMQNSLSTAIGGDGDEIVQNTTNDPASYVERGVNTLVMFAQERGRKQHESDVEQESLMSEIVSEIESKDTTQNTNPQTRVIVNDGDGMEKDHRLKRQQVERCRERTNHLNLKKPHPSVDSSNRPRHLSGKKGIVTNNEISGKKCETPSSVPITPMLETKNDSADFEADKSIPTSIAVRPPVKANHTTMPTGHTLLCKPLSVQQSKTFSQETVSNLSGGTYSSNDENELVNDSHAEMRKLPPLTDVIDDEDSGTCEQDRYQTIESKISDGNFTSADEDSDQIVDEKRSTHRLSGLAAFRPVKSYEDSLNNSASDTHSSAGSSVSQATTTVTAHTRKSMSFLREPRRNKNNVSKWNIASGRNNSNGTKRFAALKARVRVRKV